MMDYFKWFNALISFIEVIAAFATIYIVAGQLKQVKKSVRGNSYDAIMSHASMLTNLFVQHPELDIIWEREQTQEGDLERRRMWTVEMLMDFYEYMYLQYIKKDITEDMWEGWDDHIKKTFQDSKYFKRYWINQGEMYSKTFRNYIDDILLKSLKDTDIFSK